MMNNKIPQFIASHYKGGASEFRRLKRKQVKELEIALTKFSRGCAYLPCGNVPIQIIYEQIKIIKSAVSVQEFGR